MGIVINQSIKNTITTYLGFALGAINVLFLYTKFLSDAYFGLITFILSTANIMMPLMAFGVHNTIVKFFSTFKTKQTQNSFLLQMLFLPLLIIIPLGLIGHLAYDVIASWLSKENPIVKEYTWLIYVAAITFSYFEIFYAWAKVHMHTVFGNFMKEVFHRLAIMALLIALSLEWIDEEQLIYGIIGVYIVRVIIMKLYAYSIRRPVLTYVKLSNIKAILKYTLLIIIAGSVATLILEIDKFMIGKLYPEIKHVAYYGVAIYIATTIGVPMRSMHQITYPLTAKLLNENNKEELLKLYKKSSLNLFVVSGFIFLLIVANINQFYLLLPEEYKGGVFIVFAIGLVKLYDSLLGNNNSILFNSDYYRMVLFFGVLLVILTVSLNYFLIPIYGIHGAAIATVVAVFIYNTIKWVFVNSKFKMLPFTIGTLKTLLVLCIGFGLFYFWDFNFHPVFNITLKSILLSVFFVIVVCKFKLSDEICALVNKFLKRGQ